MFIGRVCGAVVSTQKDDSIRDAKLLLIEPCIARRGAASGLAPTGKNLVAVDFIGAGVDEFVLATQGSSARLTRLTKSMPVDAVVIGIVDQVRIDDHELSRTAGTLTDGARD